MNETHPPAPMTAPPAGRPVRPLQLRLSRLFVCAYGLAALLSVLALLALGLWFQLRIAGEDAQAIARTTAFALEAPLAFGDVAATQDTLSFLRARSAVHGAWAVDRDGRTVAHHGVPPDGPVGPLAALRYLQVEQPVTAGGQPLGRVVLRIDRMQAYRRLSIGAGAMVVAQLAALALSLVVVRRTARRIARPITELALTASAISRQRDYSRRLPGGGDDEVGQAIGAFNDMLDEVQRGDRALAAANRTLEERVAQRTAELAREKERAEAASLAKTRFLANMSHELRTPLNAVLGAAQLLQQSHDVTHRAHLIETIGQSGNNLLGLIENVLDVARIESGALALTPQDFNLVDAVDAAVATASIAARAGGLAMAAVVDASLPAWRYGDAMRLRQVLLNLLGNAVKFTLRGEVVLRVTPAGGDRVRFEVQDTGVGMDLATARDIFEPFAQADAATTRRFGGTGLGLTISREIVRALGGDIGVDSRIGVGSVFRFEIALPAAAGRYPSTPRLDLPVIVYEPHAASAEALMAMLERGGAQASRVHDAASLAAALDRCDGGRAPWLLVAADAPETSTLLESSAERIDPMQVIAMNDAHSHAVEMARDDLRLPRSLLKPVLRAALVSRLGATERLRGEPQPVPAVPPARTGGRVLVVDDDPTNQMIVVSMLHNAGLEPAAAADGRGALSMLREQRFDLVLMDWQMPDMDGLEVTRRIRAGAAGTPAASVPVVALTANAFAEDRAACLAVGMDDFLTKPVLAAQLLSTVRRWSDGGHAARVRSARAAGVSV